MTISIKPTASGSTIEQDGSSILSIDASGNLTVPNNMTFSGTVTGISSYSDSDALSLFNASGSAPVYACRAWVNFNGTGTVAIRESGNVSSITDNGTGHYTVNFTTAMPDVNYAVSLSNQRDYAGSKDAGFCLMKAGTSIQQTSSSFQFYTVDQAMNSNDALVAMIVVFR